MPLVSIIMPAYNCEEFISLSIESVINQSFQDWELIVVDDCSSDNTPNVVSKFLSDSRIRLHKNEINLGGAGSRNRAIELACGRFIAFLDSDDLWTADKLQKQICFMQQNKIGFTFAGYTTVTEQGALIDEINVPKQISFSDLLKHNYIGCLTAIYDSKPYGKVYMPLVRKRQDFALWLELLKKFDFAHGFKENLGFYRIRSGSLSASKKDAFKYYWRVLRNVGGCSPLSSAYYISWYLVIVFLKKKHAKTYNKLFIN